MKILCIGDIVGKAGRDAVQAILPALKKEFSPDVVIANAENSAGGSGTTPKIADELFNLGCDVLTMGDHVWDKAELREYFVKNPHIIRPANFPDGAPGSGFCIFKSKSGQKVGVINLLGRVFMRYNVNCPFRALKDIVQKIKKETPFIIVDMHAETTSEKVAIGSFIDGEVSALVGTHTHVQTADETILPRKTAYITDLGMTGPHDSVIGQNKNNIIERFLTSMPTKFEVASEDVRLNGALVEIDEKTGLAQKIIRVQRRLSEA